MRALLDTHCFLWFAWEDARLSDRAAGVIEDPDNEVYLSWAAVWEIAPKVSLGKLHLGQPFDRFIPEQMGQNGIRFLPMDLSSFHRVSTLPFLHRDPFDRLMICQCLEEDLPILSADTLFDAYGIRRIW